MSDRTALRTTLKTGLLAFEGRFTDLIKKFQGGELPAYPFVGVSFSNNGIAPYEPAQRYPTQDTVVDSSDPAFDSNIERSFQTDFFFTLSLDAVGEGSDPVSELAQSMEAYCRFLLTEHLADDGLDMVVREITDAGPQGQFIQGQVERRHTVDVRILSDLSSTITLDTIESLEFDSGSDLFAGETVDA